LQLTAVTIVSATVAQTRLVPRTGVKPLVTIGMALAAIGMYSFTRLGVHSGYAPHILPGLIVTGLGLGLIVPPSLSAATLGVQQHQVGVAAALANTSQQIGGSIGAALLSTIFASARRHYLSSHHGGSQLAATAAVHGYTTAFWWAAGIFALGLVLTLIIVPLRRVASPDQSAARPAPMTADLGSV
jgi:MFS family permease